MLRNCSRVEDLQEMSISEMAGTPPDQLALLQEEVEGALALPGVLKARSRQGSSRPMFKA